MGDFDGAAQGLANSLNLFRPLICSPDDNPTVHMIDGGPDPQCQYKQT